MSTEFDFERVNVDIQPREPEQFAIGDSLYFVRNLAEFPPVVGSQNQQAFTLKYSLYTDAGAFCLSFVSQPGPGEYTQQVLIDNFGVAPNANTPGIVDTLDVGLYVLVGTAVGPANGGAGGGTETHEIYRGKLKLTPNFAANQPVDSQQWREQKFVDLYDCLLTKLAATYVNESDIQKVKLVREKQDAIRFQLNFWEERLSARKKREDARNGRPNPDLIRAVFSICG